MINLTARIRTYTQVNYFETEGVCMKNTPVVEKTEAAAVRNRSPLQDHYLRPSFIGPFVVCAKF